MAESMKEKFDKHWDTYSVVLAFAIILDPRHKLDFVTYCYQMLHENEEVVWKVKIENISTSLFELYNEYAMEGGCNMSIATTTNSSEPTTSNSSNLSSLPQSRNPIKVI